MALLNSERKIQHHHLHHSFIPRIFQHRNDGIRTLLSGFSYLEILISASGFLIRRLGLADYDFSRHIMAARLYFRGNHISYPRGKRMAQCNIIFLVYPYPLALGCDSVALLSQPQTVVEFRFRKRSNPHEDKNQNLDSKNQILDRAFTDRSATVRIRMRGEKYGRSDFRLPPLVGDQTVPNDLKLIHGSIGNPHTGATNIFCF